MPTENQPSVDQRVVTMTPEQKVAGAKLLEQQNADRSPKPAEKPADDKGIPKENVAAVKKLFGNFMQQKRGDKPEPTEAEKVAAEAAKTKPTAKKKPTAKPVEKPAAAPAVDAEKIAAAAGRGVAEALDAREQSRIKKDASSQADEFSHLAEDERGELPVFQQMEKSNPEKYKGLSAKYSAAIKAKQEYEAKWLKDNPGKEFNPEAEEHNDFFEKNDVDWKDRDYQEAIADMKVDSRLAEERKATEKRLSEMTAKDRAREVEPMAQSESQRVAKQFFNEIGGDFANVLGEKGVVPDVIQKLNEEDPQRAGIVFSYVSDLENKSAENIRLFNGVSRYDEKNPMHKQLSDYALQCEQDLLSLEPDQRKDKEGREFSPAGDYAKMNAGQRKHHWTFSAVDLNALLSAETIIKTREALKAHDSYLQTIIKRKGFVRPDDEVENGTVVRLGPVEKPASPEGGDGLKTATPSTARPVAAKNGAQAFFGKFLARK